MRKTFFLLSILGIISFGIIHGCKDQVALQGPSNISPAMSQVRVKCSQDQLSTTKTQDIKGVNNRKVQIEGQICLSGVTTTVTGSANILFIVDRSNSMQFADPTSNGSTNCGRYRAIKKVISATVGSDSTRDISGALITFGSKAEVVSSWKPLNKLSYSDVCGIYGDKNGGTNFEDSFEKAQKLFQGKKGTNIVYFITDGAPEQHKLSDPNANDWQGGAAAGRIAMRNLKNTVSGIIINAVYLKDPMLSKPGFYGGNDVPTVSESKQYLEEIVGNPSNVKLADNADDLVTKIGTFETIPAGTFSSESDLNAYVTVNGSRTSVKIEELEYKSEGVYNYTLAATPLQGVKDKVVENTFVVKGKGSNGETSTSKVIVNFTRTN